MFVADNDDIESRQQQSNTLERDYLISAAANEEEDNDDAATGGDLSHSIGGDFGLSSIDYRPSFDDDNSSIVNSVSLQQQHLISPDKRTIATVDSSPRRSCFKSWSSPCKSVSFRAAAALLNQLDDSCVTMDTATATAAITRSREQQTATLLEPIVQRHMCKLTKLFADLRDDFNRLSRLSQISSEYDRSFAIENSPLNRQAEQAFIKNLAVNDVRQLLEAETLKREHCERKIDMLHKRCLHLEQRLTIAETHATAQKCCLDEVESDVRELLTELSVSEEHRIVKCQQLIDENVGYRKELDECSMLNESLHRQIGQLESRIDDLNATLQTERRHVDSLRNQLETVKTDADQLKKDKHDLQNDIRHLDNNYKLVCAREKELTTEMTSLQNAHSKCETKRTRLEAAINSEKTLAKQHLEQKQHEFEKKENDIRREINLQTTITIDEMRRKHENELVHINDTCETALKQAANQTEMLRRERDKLASRLATIEGDLNHRQQQISADMQHKLAAKYQELLSEFAPGNHGSSTTLVGTSRPTNFNRNMAQEFLDNLRETRPILAVDDSFDNVNSARTNPPTDRRHQLQGLLRQAIPPAETAIRSHHRAPPPPPSSHH